MAFRIERVSQPLVDSGPTDWQVLSRGLATNNSKGFTKYRINTIYTAHHCTYVTFVHSCSAVQITIFLWNMYVNIPTDLGFLKLEAPEASGFPQ